MKRLFRHIGFVVGYALSTLLLLSVLAVHVSPAEVPFLAVIALAAPFLFVLTFIFFVFSIKHKKRFFFWFTAISLVSYMPIIGNFVALSGPSARISDTDFAVLSYNVRQFDHYNWIEEEGTSTKLFQFLKTYGTNIMCLQDFYQAPDKNFNAIDTLLASGKWTDYVYSPYLKSQGLVNSGLAIFSAFPVINSALLTFPNSSNKAMYADILINKDTIRVYNLHLESTNIDLIDYDIVQGTVKTNVGLVEKISRIFQKLSLAFYKRSFQAEKIIAHIKKSPYPVLVTGDLNDTPGSYIYTLFDADLHDAFLNAGFGLGKTYISNWPWLRIDYVFYSDKFSLSKFDRCRKKLSDHYPIKAVFKIKISK